MLACPVSFTPRKSLFSYGGLMTPSEVLVSSDKRPYRNLTFHHVLARQGSSYCNRARLNFQAFALRDMTMAGREGYRGGQKKSYRFSFC